MFLLLTFFVCFTLFSADEREYEQIIDKKLATSLGGGEDRPKVKVETAYYELDLNQDASPEYIQVYKIDGLDYFAIKDSFKRTLLKKKLDTIGDKSYLYKIQLRSLSKNIKVLLLYFDQGEIDAYSFSKKAKVYFVTIEGKNLKNLHYYKGPSIFFEKKSLHSSYINRKYSVTVFDYNSDGRKEISIKDGLNTKIYSYQKNGDWTVF